MGEVVDARPDRFLREYREHGDWAKACGRSGMTPMEVGQLCDNNPKFDLAQVECQLEFLEDQMIEATEKVITQAREQREERLKLLREQAMSAYRLRHHVGVPGG